MAKDLEEVLTNIETKLGGSQKPHMDLGEHLEYIESLIGGGSGSGNVDDVKVNGTSVVEDKTANIKLKTINKQDITGEGNIDISDSYSLELEFQEPTGEQTIYPLDDEIWSDVWSKKPLLINLVLTAEGAEVVSLDLLRSAVMEYQEAMIYYSIFTLPQYDQKIAVQIVNNNGTKVLIFEQQSLGADDISDAQLFRTAPATNVDGDYCKKTRNDIIWVKIILRNASESDFTFTKGTNYRLKSMVFEDGHIAPITVMSGDNTSAVIGHFRITGTNMYPIEDFTLPAGSFVISEITYIK